MAGNRLEHWSTLPRQELQRRVQAELLRKNLKFAEQQLLSAAQERLRNWREPIIREKAYDERRRTRRK